jgi:hypothetical protein
MGETQIVSGSGLAPAPQVDDQWLQGMQRIVQVVLGKEDAPPEWAVEQPITDALDEARSWAQRWDDRAEDRQLVVERINEPSASGPGRAIKLRAAWTDRRTGRAGSRVAYPALYQDVASMVHAVRHLIEHVVRN